MFCSYFCADGARAVKLEDGSLQISAAPTDDAGMFDLEQPGPAAAAAAANAEGGGFFSRLVGQARVAVRAPELEHPPSACPPAFHTKLTGCVRVLGNVGGCGAEHREGA
eukprot:SAG11_NODE_5488_length_1547_cov_2.321823_2_plen_109_part_00